MSTKRILLICAIGCLGLIAIVGVGSYVAYRAFVKPQLGGSDLGPAGVTTGQGLLQQSVLLTDPEVGDVTDLALGKLDPRPEVALAVAGWRGASFYARDAKLVSSLAFPDYSQHVDIVDAEGDGACEFWERGPSPDGPALLGHDGRLLWRVPGGKRGATVTTSCAGDVDGDGLLEFAVGGVSGGGVQLLEHTGRVLWQKSARNVLRLEMLDTDGDGRLEIVHNGERGGLTVRDAQGRVLREVKPGGPNAFTFAVYFSVAPWPTVSDPEHILCASGNRFQLVKTSGKIVATLQAPKVGMFCETTSAHVTFREGAPPYFAVLAGFPMAHRSVLYVYDSHQHLVYQEVLPEEAGALAVLPLGKGKAEALLVGGKGRVLQYVAAGVAKP